MKWFAAFLVVLLIASNVFWLYGAVDQGVTKSYRDQKIYELNETRKQLMAVLPDVAQELSKEEVVTMVGKHTELEPYEKGGCTWVGWLGLKFDQQGVLQAVAPVWDYSGENPCLQSF